MALRPQFAAGLWGRGLTRTDSEGIAASSASAGEAALPTVVAFMSTLFGHELADSDRAELLDRLAYTVKQVPPRADEYLVFELGLDRAARDAGAENFIASSAASKAAIVDELMLIDPVALWSRVRKRLSSDYAQRCDMREKTVPALSLVYQGSGVPWRVRGYNRWPGIPGDWHEILTAGNPYR